MNEQNDHAAQSILSTSLSFRELQSSEQNADNLNATNITLKRDDSITTIADVKTVTNNVSNTADAIASGSSATHHDPRIVPPKNRKHFAMPSLSNDSLNSVVETYREQFTTPEPTVEPDPTHPKHPLDVAWKQQTLPAWQPQFRPATIVSVFLGLSVLMLSMGIPMLVTMNRAHEVVVDYTNCIWDGSTPTENKTCAQILEQRSSFSDKTKCRCKVSFELPLDFKTPVYIYYELNGFFQNHRRYVASVDYNQLYGKDVDPSTLQSNCEPYGLRKNDSKPYGPCGAIANSLFSDEYRLLDAAGNKIDIENTGITWPTDKAFRFRNPSDWSKYAQPINWSIPANELDTINAENNGYKNEHFIVWMRTAAFPKFRKLWGKILPKSSFNKLQKGRYTIHIDYNYKTVQNKLKIPKSFVIATSTWLGGKNLFLPILYIVCGSISFITGIFFLILTKRMMAKDRHRTDTVSMATGTYHTMAQTSTGY